MNDYWVDGHYIIAANPDAARAEVKFLYGYDAFAVRPWTAQDQADLDAED